MTTPDLQLSQELQELYLENKEYMSQSLFLSDEYRFFRELFENRYSVMSKQHSEEEICFVGNSLAELKSQLEMLKALILEHQHLLEKILKDENQRIGLALIEENSNISIRIKSLLSADKRIKKALFQLVSLK